jgi:hypothetical protein
VKAMTISDMGDKDMAGGKIMPEDNPKLRVLDLFSGILGRRF